MKLENIINEKIEIKSEIEKINTNFRNYLKLVFNKEFISKLDRVFKKPILVDDFKEKSNIMAITIEDKIFVNTKNFNELETDRAMVYIIHEFFHILQNIPQFPEIKTINRILGDKTMKYINRKDISRFLTGKQQNIHSNYKNEFLSYCSNNAFDWTLCPKLKEEYKRILNQSGVFNFSSNWWKERFQ